MSTAPGRAEVVLEVLIGSVVGILWAAHVGTDFDTLEGLLVVTLMTGLAVSLAVLLPWVGREKHHNWRPRCRSCREELPTEAELSRSGERYVHCSECGEYNGPEMWQDDSF